MNAVSRAARINTVEPLRYGAVLYLTLIAAGLAGNYFKYPIFLNIDFLFGSLFAMLALQCFGTGRGVAAGALIASYTYVLWNEPYAFVIMTAEVAMVGWLVIHRKTGLVLADALYWLFIGMPLGYFFYNIVLDVSPGSEYIIMTKQAVNGIANALLARLIFTGFALRSRTTLIGYRDVIYNLLAFFALCPALILLVIASRVDFNETDHNIRANLHQANHSVASRIDVWVQNRTASIVNLAGLAATLTPREMQPRLEQALNSDVNFQRIGMRDAESTIIAYAPPIDEFGQSNIGKKFAERPYIAELRRTRKPMLAEVVMGRIGTPEPVAILLTAVIKQGEFAGYVNSVLRLEQVRDYLEKSAEGSAMQYTLLDKIGNTILSNRKEQKVMSPLLRGEGNLNLLDKDISQWIPSLPPQTSISERWKSSFYVTESPVGSPGGWTLVLEQPVAPFQKILYARYTEALALVLLILFAALVLAELLSRRVVASNEQLSELTQSLPAALGAGEDSVWPVSAIAESNRLIGSFKEMSRSLEAQFSANRQLNATLERRVEERTRALALSNTELKRSNADLEQFAYAASHDMSQPLRMISSYLQLLEVELAPTLNAEMRQHFQFATEGALRMDQMLNALLEYSRIGRVNEGMALIESREVVNEALHFLGTEIAQAAAEVRIDGEWPPIFACRDEILRLLQNLIENALKFRLEGRNPDIVLNSQASDGEWRVAVRDNGVGLLPGQEERLFKVFERLQSRSRYPGTGIGLALCRRIVEHHNGHIRVESPGENLGCVFIFSLPVLGKTGAAEASGETGSPGGNGDTP